MATAAQITANRLNAQKSTGPRSVEGKAASRFNALKHGLDAESAVIPGEDPAALAELAAEYHDHFQPLGPVETGLVDTLVRTEWLKRRYLRIETAILNHLLAAHPDDPNALGAIYAEAKPSSPIHKIAARLEAANRTWFRAHKELNALQAERSQFEDALDPEPPAGPLEFPLSQPAAILPAICAQPREPVAPNRS